MRGVLKERTVVDIFRKATKKHNVSFTDFCKKVKLWEKA